MWLGCWAPAGFCGWLALGIRSRGQVFLSWIRALPWVESRLRLLPRCWLGSAIVGADKVFRVAAQGDRHESSCESIPFKSGVDGWYLRLALDCRDWNCVCAGRGS